VASRLAGHTTHLPFINSVATFIMKTSLEWYRHFSHNGAIQRIDWNQQTTLTLVERKTILRSLQAWQLGETSDGSNLLKASAKYAAKTGDPFYLKSIQLFIKEEQKHGENLGRYLDRIGEARIQKDWGDTLFRRFRYFSNSMEVWTLTVLTVESTAQLFYQALKTATNCLLLRQVCTDILIDEAPHIAFQRERLAIIFQRRSTWLQGGVFYGYKLFYYATAVVVWAANRKVFTAGGYPLRRYFRSMRAKFRRNFQCSLLQPSPQAITSTTTQAVKAVLPTTR
jgi:hypothetical protein